MLQWHFESNIDYLSSSITSDTIDEFKNSQLCVFVFLLWIKLTSFFFFFLFSLTIFSAGLWSNFQTEISLDLHVLKSPEFKDHIFRRSHFLFSVCFCMYPCLFVISISQKQITAETSNLVFNICVIHGCFLKLFIMIGQKLCVQGHTKEFKYIKAYGRNFVLVNFRIFSLR